MANVWKSGQIDVVHPLLSPYGVPAIKIQVIKLYDNYLYLLRHLHRPISYFKLTRVFKVSFCGWTGSSSLRVCAVFQRTQVQFTALTSGNAELVTPTLGGSDASGLYGYLYSHAHTHTHPTTHNLR